MRSNAKFMSQISTVYIIIEEHLIVIFIEIVSLKK